MKKYLLILLLLISTLCFGDNVREVPKETSQKIRDLAYDTMDTGSERVDFIKWQEQAYWVVEDELAVSETTDAEKEAIRKRLNAMYGANYAKQTKEVKEQVKYYTTVSRAANEKKEAEVRNEASKEELTTVVEDAKGVVPAKMMKHYEQEAQRLYPNNYYEQKRFIESSVNTYKMFNKQ